MKRIFFILVLAVLGMTQAGAQEYALKNFLGPTAMSFPNLLDLFCDLFAAFALTLSL